MSLELSNKQMRTTTGRLDGKRALVTGGNSGIGEAIAYRLADAGARVAINYVADPEAARTVATRIRDRGGAAITLEADVSDPGAVAEMFTRLDGTWKGIDILINNAGIDGVRAPGWEADLAAWRKVIEVNLFGAFYCACEALRRMVPQQRGVILNMSSVHEEIAWSGYSAYAASKAAIGMLTKTLAQEALLVSDSAAYVTGRTVFVDGGMTDYPSFTHGG